MEISQWEKGIKMGREQKDMFFAEHFQSPISFEERSQFTGLNYYALKSLISLKRT
jgi:hypothetical protein